MLNGGSVCPIRAEDFDGADFKNTHGRAEKLSKRAVMEFSNSIDRVLEKANKNYRMLISLFRIKLI